MNRNSTKQIVTVIGSFDDNGFGNVMRLTHPTIPPMLRAPLTNLHNLDFVVVSNEVKTKGPGGIIATGYFDNFWKIDDKIMYNKKCF